MGLMQRITGLFVFVIGFGLGEPLFATESLMKQLPNAPVACHTCHVAGPGLYLNSFGRDVATVMAGENLPWERLALVDSDSDGFSNGLELGDPCGTWVPGERVPRILGVSSPGNTASTPASDVSRLCVDGEPAPEELLERPSVEPGITISNDAGQTSFTCASTSPWGSSWILSLIGGVFLIRRQRAT